MPPLSKEDSYERTYAYGYTTRNRSKGYLDRIRRNNDVIAFNTFKIDALGYPVLYDTLKYHIIQDWRR